METSNEMRRLTKKWVSGGGWPKRLEWIEINGIRGWVGQRIEFQYPIVSIVGENGSGKSTILQSAASIYRAEDDKNTFFPSGFFPDTAWDKVTNTTIKYGYTEGQDHKEDSVRKPTDTWLGNVKRPIRNIRYIDLSRTQPLAVRVGYARIASYIHQETTSTPFDDLKVQRLSAVMGHSYDSAKMAKTNVDNKREIPVFSKNGINFSGYHFGSGETTVADLLRAEFPRYSLVLIDEIEASLHPRAQRRLIRDLAESCREKEIQIILTTHSPYILEELPLEARICILETQGQKDIVRGVSPQFAMSKMDDESHPECDVYVEDISAKIMLSEILAQHQKALFTKCLIIPFGASSVGRALGIMTSQGRHPRKTIVFLDGDNAASVGCNLLPGGDAPEQVVFTSLQKRNWGDLCLRIGRDISMVTDVCNRAMTIGDHHQWVSASARDLWCGGETLWQAMCAEWAKTLSPEEAKSVYQPIEDLLL